MAATRKKRTSKKCHSCRKLKIRCDLVKPTCEYCLATRRLCVYDEQQKEMKNEPKEVTIQENVSSSLSEVHSISVESLLNELGDLEGIDGLDGVSKRSDSLESLVAVESLDPFDYSPLSTFLLPTSSSKDFEVPESPIMDLYPITSSSYISLNSMSSHLQISKFEYSLLKFFNNYYLEKSLAFNQLNQGFQLQIPYLWHKSSTLRDNIYSLSCMYLFCLNSIKDEGAVNMIITDKRLIGYRESALDVIGDLDRDSELYCKCLEYFNRCLKQSQNQIKIWEKADHENTELDEAADVIISGVMLYLFLTLQPFEALPVLSDKGSPDLVSLCRSMRKYLGSQFSYLAGSRYNDLMFFSDCSPMGVIFSGFPFINILYQDLLKLRASEEVSQKDFEVHLESMLVFDRSFLKSTENNNWSGIFRWLFLLKEEAYEMMENQDFYSIRLLFMYCCTFYFAGLKFLNGNMEYYALIQFAKWYREFNYKNYGNWRYQMDEDAYTLVVEFHYTFPLRNFDHLFTFNPSKIVSNLRTALA